MNARILLSASGVVKAEKTKDAENAKDRRGRGGFVVGYVGRLEAL